MFEFIKLLMRNYNINYLQSLYYNKGKLKIEAKSDSDTFILNVRFKSITKHQIIINYETINKFNNNINSSDSCLIVTPTLIKNLLM